MLPSCVLLQLLLALEHHKLLLKAAVMPTQVVLMPEVLCRERQVCSCQGIQRHLNMASMVYILLARYDIQRPNNIEMLFFIRTSASDREGGLTL